MTNWNWVTFYEDIVNGITEVKAHETNSEAKKEFANLVRTHFGSFFIELPFKMPNSYGNDVRKVHIMRYEDFCREVEDADGLIKYWKERI